jgi:hypothetical protein
MLVTSNFKKHAKEVSKKLDFGHLRVKGENDDDDPRAEKFSGGGVNLPDFSHVGVRGLAKCTTRPSPRQKFCSGVSKIADFRHL